MKSTMQPRPSSDAIKERAHQLWRTQKASENHIIRRTPEFNQCVHKDLWNGKVSVRRANCIANVVFLENQSPNQLVKFDVKDGYIDVDWLDMKTNELTGDCSGCGGPEKLDTFKKLCPAKYREFGGIEP